MATQLSEGEAALLRYLLARVEKKEDVIELLFRSMLIKYQENLVEAASAMGVSIKALRLWIDRRPKAH
jgi:hypothetical protein